MQSNFKQDSPTVKSILDWLETLSRKYDFLLADERRLIPPNILLEFGKHGLFGLQVDRKYGGLNLSFSDTAEVIEKLASINLSLATIVTTHANGIYSIANYGTEILKNQHLPDLSQGRGLAAFALTEECAGSYVYALETIAKPETNNTWSINGKKIWVDSGAWASIVVTFCKSSLTGAQQKFVAFAIPTNTSGVEIGEESYTMGLKTMVQNEISFDKAIVTEDELLGAGDDGLIIANETLDRSRLLMGIKSLGASKRCLHLLINYAKNRTISTGLLFDNPVTTNTIGNISLRILTLEIAIKKLVQLFDANCKIPSEILMMLKIFGSDLVNYSADCALQVLGGRGYMEQNFVSQIFRDARSFKLSEGANEALNSHIGSVLAYAGEEIYEFFIKELQALQYADQLRTFSSTLYQDYLANNGSNAHNNTNEYWFFYLLGKIATYKFLLSVVQLSCDIEENKKAILIKYLVSELNDALADASPLSRSSLLLESSEVIRSIADNHLAQLTDLKTTCFQVERTTDILLARRNDSYNQLSILYGDLKYYDLQSRINLAEFIMHKFSSYGNEIAITCLNDTVTYSQLLEGVDKISNMLLEKGVKPGDIVGIFIPHSIPLIVTLLSVLKVGATYIPLDVTYPENRLKYIIDDSKLKVIITTQDLAETIKNQVQIVLTIESSSGYKVTQEVPFSENKLAYIIYTSGSSGKPKGVKVRSDAVMNFLLSMQDKIEVTSEDIFLMHTTISFDIAILEIFLPLMIGARIVIVPHNLRHDSNQLLEYINNQNITVLQATPSFWQMLIEYGWNGTNNLKSIAGGETLYQAMAKKIIAISRKVWNVYGPTEATVWASIYLINQIPHDAVIPIGTPLNNLSFYIIDENHEVVKNGENGEICTGGVCLADGYVNRPDLDKEKFVNISINGNSVLVYKTGDIGQIHNENLICFGRNDRQVKHNGHRIELGEIENVLLQHNQITSVAVTKIRDDNDSEWLVVYYTSNSKNLEDRELRHHLKDYLPDYMLPSVYVKLEKMPLTHNHKIDYNSLPQLTHVENDTNTLTLESTDIISVLLSIWQNLFKSTNINKHSNFFELGGNSLLALKLISHIRDQLKFPLLISELYQRPTIFDLSKVIAISDNQTINNLPVISKYTISSIKEQKLSFAQERLLFIEKYENGSNVYNTPFAFKVNKYVNIDLLKDSLLSVINRHEILRSLIKTDDEGNSYLLTENLNIKPLIINHLSVENYDELRSAISNTSNQVFELGREYPIRLTLYSNRIDNSNYLSLVVHHIVFDGWSADVFLNDLINYYAYYEKLAQNKESNLMLLPLSIQYKDFALWQRSYLVGEYLAQELLYWKNKLSNFEALNLSLDKPRPQTVCYDGEDVHFTLEKPISLKLRDVAKKLQVSLYSILLSGFYLLLKGYSNQNDIIIGSPVANRNYNQTENLIGFFVNNIALRSKIIEDSLLVNYIKEVGKDIIDIQLHQDLPFEKLLDELNVPRDPSRHPIFQVVFGLQSFGNKKFGVEGKTLLEPYLEGVTTNTAKFDLMVMLDDSNRGISGVFNYATALFNKKSIENFIATYKHILIQIANLNTSSNIPIKALSYLDKENCKEIVMVGNNDDRIYQKGKTLVDVFIEQSSQSAESIVVIEYDGSSYTYKDLALESRLFAKHLLEHEALNPLIAILSEKGYNQVISMLAIMLSGHAYLPLHVDWPSGRIVEVLNSGIVETILISRKQYSNIQLRNNLKKPYKLIVIEDLLEKIKTDSAFVTSLDKFELPAIDEDNIAYVIFTSGSTGKPKGVTISHKAALNTIYAVNDEFKVSQLDKVLALSELSFDLSVYDIFGLLCAGGTVIFPKQETVKNSLHWIELIDKYQITIWNTVPQLADLLIEAIGFSKFALNSLRLFLLSGDYIPLNLPDRIRSQISNSEVVSLGGATEGSIWSIWYKIKEIQKNWNSIPYGVAMPNQKIYVLDKSGNILPMGAIGEICIGGCGVALGYWHDTERTKNSFFEHQSLGRLYRTGDYGLLSLEGHFKFIGRNDFQIKMRGYRIELGEIERILNSYPRIKQSVVLAVTNIQTNYLDNKYLAAYYVSPDPLQEDEVFTYLNTMLPEYMVPSILVHLKHLPLTINGKLDRSTLPEAIHTDKDNFIAPRNGLETKVCNLYAEILGMQPNTVGINNDFFKLGGSSILAIKLINRLNKEYDLNFELNYVFKYKNVEQMAIQIISNNTPGNDLEVIREGVI